MCSSVCAEADSGPRQQQPVPGQGQRGGQPGAQCQRLHTLTLPTVAAAQRHTTRGLLTALRPLPNVHAHTHTQQPGASGQTSGHVLFYSGTRTETSPEGIQEDGWDGTTSARDQRMESLQASSERTERTVEIPSKRPYLLFYICFGGFLKKRF